MKIKKKNVPSFSVYIVGYDSMFVIKLLLTEMEFLYNL